MIDVEITGSKLLVSQGKTNIEFTPHDVLDYPEFKEPGQYNSELEISGGDLLEIIEKVSFTAANGNEAIKHSLNGIYLEGKEGKITACGTNGCRMAIFQKEVPNAEFDGIVIPKEVLPEMKRVVNKVDTIKLKIADTKIILEKDGLFFAANLIDDTYPDFKSIIPDDLEQKLTVEKNAFVKGIKMVMTIIEKTEPIKVTVTGNKMELGAENDTGTIKRVIAVETEDCKEFGINPVFLLDAISHIEANKICMEFSEKERKPVMIRNEGYTHLIMPVIL